MLMVTMCKVLADILGTDDPLFAIGIRQLEKASGQAGVDVRLYSEILRKSHQKTRELGLNPRDTTAEELYHALMGLVEKHDRFLAKRLGADDPADVQDVLARAQRFAQALDTPKSAWVLKSAAAKRLLKLTPPKKVMKQLGYRSVDSMLKREPIAELYIALRFTESPEWLSSFTKKYKQLSQRDFETRDVKFIRMDAKKWGVATETLVRSQRHNVTHMKEMGVIAILPLPVKRMPGITIAVLPLLLHYLNEIRMYSTYFKLQQVRPDFGDKIAQTIAHDPHNHAKVAGHDVHWRIVQRHFGKSGAMNYTEVFEPYVQASDLLWRKAEDILYRIEPALHFWHDMDYVGVKIGKEVVSFNLMDMAVNYVNRLPYGQHTVHRMRAGLWNEIFARYIGQPALESQVIKQLANESENTNIMDKSLEEMFL